MIIYRERIELPGVPDDLYIDIRTDSVEVEFR